MHLTSKQATEQYKVSIRTLRTLIAGLTAEQKQMHLLIKGKQHLISTELLNQHYQARPGAKVQNKGAKQVQSDRAATDAPPTDTPRPKPNNTTGEPFIWFVVGLVFGLFVVGLVVYSSY